MILPQNDALGQPTRAARNCTPVHRGADLLTWYFDQFIPAPARGYALMNPPGHEHKYTRRQEPLTPELVYGALNGQTRRTRAGGDWQTTPISLAVTPQTQTDRPLAKNIALDVDSGGKLALFALLETCQRVGLAAFAQLGESPTHNGGYVWILGSEMLPAALLHEVGQRLAQAAGIGCEVWPTAADVRLPLMPHLRAPGGPRRFPLILPTGELVETVNPWLAIEQLRDLPLNPPDALSHALGVLPSLPKGGGGPAPRHKSDVNPGKVTSVIAWFNANFSLESELQAAGAEVGRALICCPFHDDQHPSLALFRTEDDKPVAHCFSRGSHCPAAAVPYVDAFDVYCLRHQLTPSAAVKRLVEQYELGRKREFRGEIHPPSQPKITFDQHRGLVRDARQTLVNALVAGADQEGQVTVIRGTPGIGKTHVGAELANRLHSEGKTVFICAPTLEVAQNEWATRLKKPYVWRSKLELCTCHDQKLLGLCVRMGYGLPQCTNPECPYARQTTASFGHVVILQHNHLCIKEGERFIGSSLVIVDESPLNALLPQRHVTPGTLAGFAKRHPTDPAAPLVRAMAAAAADLPVKMVDIRGAELAAVIEQHLGGVALAEAVSAALASPFNEAQPVPPADPALMAPQFLAGLLGVLVNHPERLSWGRGDQGHGQYIWHDRQVLAPAAHDSMFPPAVIVLDGSADKTVAQELLAPWPVAFVEIDCPISPLVELVQVNCTASTRSALLEERKIADLARSIAYVCNQAGITLEGGISYQRAAPMLAAMLGGEWLHYGGQRGSNALDRARAIAVVCSPTTPPATIERKALALWADVTTHWTPAGISGLYAGADPRLDAMNRLHGAEELRQSVYRARPLTAPAPMTLLVFSPWPLPMIGLQPSTTVAEIPHGLSAEMTGQIDAYRARSLSAEKYLHAQPTATFWRFPEGNKYIELAPPFGNDEKVAVNPSDSHESNTSPPLSAQEENPAPDAPAGDTGPTVNVPAPVVSPAASAAERRARAMAAAQAAIAASVERSGGANVVERRKLGVTT